MNMQIDFETLKMDVNFYKSIYFCYVLCYAMQLLGFEGGVLMYRRIVSLFKDLERCVAILGFIRKLSKLCVKMQKRSTSLLEKCQNIFFSTRISIE